MAERDGAAERGADVGAPSGGKRGKLALFGAVGGIMLLEGAAIFVATRFLGGSAGDAQAQVPGLADAQDAPPEVLDAEMLVAEFRAMNDRSGQNVIYDMKIFGRVPGEMAEQATQVFESKKASVEDRLARVVRAADPAFFKEPGLETLRRQFKHELADVLGNENLVDEVLITKLMWYNADM
ncbi:MAG: hypothetical protein JXA69_04200 [Phycisphaerae bacterium]|nr:hypothetical protein [Phycisphaerae bacterium]